MFQKYLIRKEEPKDYREVENLVRESFWNVYKPGCDEHYLLHQLRKKEDFVKDLDFVLVVEGKIIGQICFVKNFIKKSDSELLPVMTFGPISILPEYKRKGYGILLLDYSLEKAKELGVGAVCIEGNILFYKNSGFIVGSSLNIRYYGEPDQKDVPYFLVKELKPGYLKNVQGMYLEPLSYRINKKDVDEFDKEFPPKIKLKLPGQLFE